MTIAPGEDRSGTVLDGRYRLDRLLGAGAMGAVYVASTQQGGRCAIKLLLDPSFVGNRDLLGRFVREGRVTAEIRSPNVVEVYELGVDTSARVPFIAMELLDGFDVDGLIGKVGPIEPAIAVRIAMQAANGLAAAHSEGVIHRDVKPANLFLHRDPTSSAVVVKVADFGIAKSMMVSNEQMTATGTTLGSPLFMSPEQIRSAKHTGPRSDVWSLAMSLWTMLAGRPAFVDVRTLAELAVALSQGTVPWLQEAAPWVDGGLAALVHGALIRDVDARCPSMPAFAEALARFSGGRSSLVVEELRGATPELRGKVAARTNAGTSWSESLAQSAGGEDEHAEEMRNLVGATIGGYRLERLLGRGGMGAVYEGVDAKGTYVAVKVILGGDRHRPDVLRRFVREAKSTTAIASPNVVRVLDVDGDSSRGVPFIVMELLTGMDLDHVIKDRGPLEPATVAKLFIGACNGLSAAHAQGIVHRDIKPANIFLHCEPDGRVTPKICDFGIAKQLEVEGGGLGASTELTRTGGVIGSPSYMSPEQAKSSRSVGLTTDVWSLGVALYEALGGRRPWAKCGSVGELMVAILTEAVPPLQDHAPWIDPGLAEVVDRALQKSPGARFPSMEAFAAALAPFAHEAPLVVQSLEPISTTRRSKVAPRSTFAGTITNAGAETSARAPGETKRSRAPIFVAAAVAVVGISIGGYALSRPAHREETKANATRETGEARETTGATSATTSASKGTESAMASVHARVKIAPTNATVTVDGKARAVDAGAITLDGEPGASFTVVVSAGGRSTEREVTLRRDGKASLDAIEVATKGAPQPTKGAAMGTNAPSAATTAAATMTVDPKVGTTPTAPATTTVVAPPPTASVMTAPTF